MTPERWKEVEAVFEQALDLAAGERAAFVQKACRGNDELRCEVESLLDSHASAGSFIDERSLFFSGDDLNDDDAAVASGQLIGPYRIVREIGRGGMGAVYLAERADAQYEKRVAIKLIKRGMDTESVLRHFRTERQILANFDHPNIARLLDGGTTENGLPYFVMEYVEGLPIDEYCGKQALSIDERLKLFCQVCAAVSYAHRHLVIHRDLKRSNILITSEGVPKLLDFGIAKILQEGDGAQAFATMTGLRLMTPEYASPEQVRGEPVTTASDVYSLGVVLYELLTGRLPYEFASHSLRDMEHAITETEPKRPSTLIASAKDQKSEIRIQKLLKGDLDNIVLMALRKEPERRYQSVEQFSEDIRRHLVALPVRARKETAGYRASKFIRRNRVGVAAATLLFFSLVSGIIATTWQAHRARQQEDLAKAEKARAEHRFNDVRKLANSVLFDYHDAIKDLPGATKVRERLVKDALTYLDSLAAESAGDPALQRELAAAYERVGDVRGRAFSANLGDIAGSMDSYQKALRIREAIVAPSPQDAQSRRDLAGSYVRIGIQLIETNEAARGMDYLHKALAIYLELSAEQPANSEMRYELAAAYNELGLALEDWWGDSSGALENHRKALSIRENFVAADPGNQKYRRDLSVTYVNIGRALVQSGNTQAALKSNQKALAVRAALFAENPSNADYRRLLAISYQNDGNYRAILGDVDGALQSFRKKLALDEQSLADDPVNAQTCEDLGFSCERIGDLLAKSADYVQALSYYGRALAMYEKVSAVAPQILRVRYRLIFARAGIGEMQAKVGRRTLALAECSKASALLDEMPRDPEMSWQRSMRGEVYIHLAQAYAALATSQDGVKNEQREHWRAARDSYQRAFDLMKDLRDRGILDAEEATEIETITRKMGECDIALSE